MHILFLGDSLIEYFDWQERFPEHVIANLGSAGESVQGLLTRVLRLFKAHPATDRIFIMTGINNVAMGDMEFLGFYSVILEKLAAFYPDAVICIHSLLPVLTDFISNDSVGMVNDSMKNLALDRNVQYLDLYSRFVDTKGRPIREYLLDDGVHLSRSGYEVWARVVEEIIN